MSATAELHDGSSIPFVREGTGPAILLPVNPVPAEGEKADALRQWGVDPALGRTLIDGLSDAFTVIAADYEGHVLTHPKPDSLTPDAIAADLLAIADAAGAGRFACYGYSWLALSGLQLAVRTDRLAALAMGGFPPLGGPYAEMLAVTRATHAMAGEASEPSGKSWDGDWDSVEVGLSEAQTRQFVTLYEALRGFDDTAVDLAIPRLCFAGSADTINYGERWGNTVVDIAGAFARNRDALVTAGWEVEVLDGLDHTGAMQPGAVLPVLRPWLEKALG